MKRIHNTHSLWALLLIVAGQRDMQAAGLDKVKQLSAEESVSADMLSLTFGNGEKVSLSKELAQRSGLLANALSGEPDAKSIPINKSFCAGFTLEEIVALLTIDDWTTYLHDKDDNELYRLFLLHRYLGMPELFKALAHKIGVKIAAETSADGAGPKASSHEQSKIDLDDAEKRFAQTIAKNIGFIPTTEHTTLQGHTRGVASVAYSPNGSRIASGSYDRTVRIWDAATGEPVGAPLQGDTSPVSSVVYSPDGKHIVSGSWDRTVRIWDAATGVQVGAPLQGHTGGVNSVAYSPDGTHIASGSADTTVRIWDATTGGQIGVPLQGHTNSVTSVAYSNDGKHIASGSWDHTVRIWDAFTGALLHTLAGHTGVVSSVALSPDGKHIVSGSWDDTVRIWDAATGGLVRTLAGHTGRVFSVAYSPDGKQIVSGLDGSENHTVRIWDAATGALLHTLQGHTSLVNSVAYSPDGAQIASGSFDNTVRIWGESMKQRVVRAEQWIKNVLKKAEAKSSFIKGVQSRYVSPSLADMQAATNLSSGNSAKQQNSRNKPYRLKPLGKPKPIAFNDSMVAAATKLERRQGLSSEDRTSLQNLQSLLSRAINSREKADADSSSKESGLADLQEIVTSERILYPAEIDYLRSLDQKITEALNQGSSSLMPSSGPASAGGGERE